MEKQKTPVLECKNICKIFPGVKALDHVNMTLYPGEIRGLVGENGAGKSTLIKVISGVYGYTEMKDEPEEENGLFLEGKKIKLNGIADANNLEIRAIHQELNVIPDSTVYENEFLNYYIKKFGIVNHKEMKEQTEQLLKSFGADFHAWDKVGDLTVDRQKMVEVIRAIRKSTKILILDEPTSMLTDVEAKNLFKMMRKAADQGIALVFITHNLQEIVEMCDVVTVMRDGRVVGELENSKHSLSVDDDIIPLMVGHAVETTIEFKSSKTDKVLLSLENIGFKKRIQNFNMDLHSGEIIGITGLVGAGGQQLARTVYGVKGNLKTSGRIKLNGKELKIRKTEDAFRSGIAYLTADRKKEGLFLPFPIKFNISIPSIKEKSKYGIVNFDECARKSEEHMKSLRIKANDINTVVGTLSGGNQQKVVLAKWLEAKPEVLIMDEPTIGVDVSAKEEIRKIIKNMVAEDDRAVILITSEYVEMKNLCDRIFIMFNGEVVAVIPNSELTQELYYKYALGGSDSNE